MSSLLRPYLYALLLLAVSACASTEKQFEKAGSMEADGRYADAAEAYLEVLGRDANWPGARDRLTEVGPLAITQLVDEATSAAEGGNPVSGLTTLRRAENLVDRAAPYNVILSLPPGYRELERGMNDDAVVQLTQQAEDAASRGSWSTAVNAYERAIGGYSITSSTRRDLTIARERTRLDWARDDAREGRFRTAHDRALEVVSNIGALDDSLAEAARNLADDALADGEVVLAILPFWQTEAWQAAAPRTITEDLNDALAVDHSEPPSPFIALLDPISARREVRALRLDEAILDDDALQDIARQLRIDMIVAGEGVEFVRTERSRGSRTESARVGSSSGMSVNYRKVDLEVRQRGEVAFRVWDDAARRIVFEGTVDESISERFDRAYYEGDWTTLDLSARDRRLFDEDEHRDQEDELGRRLADLLAEKLAVAIYSEVLSRID